MDRRNTGKLTVLQRSIYISASEGHGLFYIKLLRLDVLYQNHLMPFIDNGYFFIEGQDKIAFQGHIRLLCH